MLEIDSISYRSGIESDSVKINTFFSDSSLKKWHGAHCCCFWFPSLMTTQKKMKWLMGIGDLNPKAMY